MYKIDLHTHSVASPDGSLTLADYRQILETDRLDCIAITDHNTIDFALQVQKELGKQIIVGEEISALEGELIGLYLHKTIPSGLTAAETVAAIRDQKGLVYIPHPFETMRKGLSKTVLDTLAEACDIVEVRNGRAVFQNKGLQARTWATEHNIPGAASSDAHGRYGWARTYSNISAIPTQKNLPALLANATYRAKTVGLGIVYPRLNRLRKRANRAA